MSDCDPAVIADLRAMARAAMRPVIPQRRRIAPGQTHRLAPGETVLVALRPSVAARYASQGLVVREYQSRSAAPAGPKLPPVLRLQLPLEGAAGIGIVVGGAEDVLAEYEKAKDMCAAAGKNFTTLVTNDMIEHFTDCCDHAVTLHARVKLPLWLKARAKKGLPVPARVWAQKAEPLVTDASREWGQGSVGLFAVKIALLELKLSQVLLCGVPMTVEAGHFRRQRPWKDAGVFRREWLARKDEIASCVRSFSGWTAGLLGTPTTEFVKSAQGVMP
jgi:hypothetical protein